MSELNWDDLRFLVIIGREGTLAAAARVLHVDQTTVARRLRGLERALGAALFARGDRAWQPTAVGERVLERATRIEEDIAGVVRTAESVTHTVSGQVRITSVTALIADYLIPRLPELYARYPELTIDLIASNSNLNVSRHEADIALRLARPESGDFLIRKLAETGVAVYASARTDRDARAGDWVTYNADLKHTPEMRWLEPQLRNGRVRLRANSLPGLVSAIANGVGRGILPCFVGDSRPELIRVSGPEPILVRDVWLLIHRESRQLARVGATVDWLTERFGADADALRGMRAEPTKPRARTGARR